MSLFKLVKQGFVVGPSVALAKLFKTSSYKIGVYNGVPVRNLRLLSQIDEYPEYETALCRFSTGIIKECQDVVIIGGGLGVSTVKAANQAGENGTAKTYEASEHRYKIAKNTIQLNQINHIVDLKHDVIGHANHVFKEIGEAPTVAAGDLPSKCDVLIMDCEGAELKILREMEIRPNTIIVESHGVHGSPTSEVSEVLDGYDYQIIDTEPENKEKDVIVLKASIKP